MNCGTEGSLGISSILNNEANGETTTGNPDQEGIQTKIISKDKNKLLKIMDVEIIIDILNDDADYHEFKAIMIILLARIVNVSTISMKIRMAKAIASKRREVGKSIILNAGNVAVIADGLFKVLDEDVLKSKKLSRDDLEMVRRIATNVESAMIDMIGKLIEGTEALKDDDKDNFGLLWIHKNVIAPRLKDRRTALRSKLKDVEDVVSRSILDESLGQNRQEYVQSMVYNVMAMKQIEAYKSIICRSRSRSISISKCIEKQQEERRQMEDCMSSLMASSNAATKEICEMSSNERICDLKINIKIIGMIHEYLCLDMLEAMKQAESEDVEENENGEGICGNAMRLVLNVLCFMKHGDEKSKDMSVKEEISWQMVMELVYIVVSTVYLNDKNRDMYTREVCNCITLEYMKRCLLPLMRSDEGMGKSKATSQVSGMNRLAEERQEVIEKLDILLDEMNKMLDRIDRVLNITDKMLNDIMNDAIKNRPRIFSVQLTVVLVIMLGSLIMANNIQNVLDSKPKDVEDVSQLEEN